MKKTVVIIGGGFSGTLTAAHLLRNRQGAGLRVVLLNRSGRMARGVAYGTRAEVHVLNVPAGQMSAYPADPEHFLRFVRERDESVQPSTFVQRRIYGDYLEWLLNEARALGSPHNTLDHRDAHAVDIESSECGGTVVTLEGGERLHADAMVLALGNYTPADPALTGPSLFASHRYTRDPWAPGALEGGAPDEPVLLLGTGLTMYDVALDLWRRGQHAPMFAVSRRGLLPQEHRPAVPTTPELPALDLLRAEHTARSYLRGVRGHVRALAAMEVDWRHAVAALRPTTTALWQALNLAERRRFLRHVRPYWEVHRHRAAPEIADGIASLTATGALVVRRGRLLALEESGEGVRAVIRASAGGAPEMRSLRVARVINCTGPSSDLRTLREPLILAMRRRGMLRPDPLGLGLDTAENLALLDAAGRAQPVIFYVGPLLRAQHWESTAVPELRVHAARAAAAVASALAPDANRCSGNGMPSASPMPPVPPAPPAPPAAARESAPVSACTRRMR